MPGNAEYIARFKQWRQNLNKDDHWCIMINADPDALASALALKRIMLHKVHSAEIMRINEVTRPDNLAMIRYPAHPGQSMAAGKEDPVQPFRHCGFPTAAQQGLPGHPL